MVRIRSRDMLRREPIGKGMGRRNLAMFGCGAAGKSTMSQRKQPRVSDAH